MVRSATSPRTQRRWTVPLALAMTALLGLGAERGARAQPKPGVQDPRAARDQLRGLFFLLDRDRDEQLDAREYSAPRAARDEGAAPPEGQPFTERSFTSYATRWAVPRLAMRYCFGRGIDFPLSEAAFERRGLGELFSAVDLDADGAVTAEEWRKGPQALWSAVGFPYPAAATALLDFDPKDASGDGSLDATEAATAVRCLDTDGDRSVTLKEFLDGLLARAGYGGPASWFMAADRNGDQRLQPDEVVAAGLSPDLDGDRDGLVTLHDLLAREVAAQPRPQPTPPAPAGPPRPPPPDDARASAPSARAWTAWSLASAAAGTSALLTLGATVAARRRRRRGPETARLPVRDVRERLEGATAAARTSGEALSPEAALERLSERYRDPRAIGVGGMGAVFAVFDRALHRDVAVKLLHASLLDEARHRERFIREARALARLSHPAIPPVFDLAAEPVPYYSMPLLRGQNLDKYRATHQGADVSFERLLTIGLDVAGALAHAHDRGVLHRDVKPANVMVADEGRAYLVDFGLAKMDDATGLTRTNEVVGTLRYLAPETLEGKAHDVRTEVWALGMTLFELFTGSHPFGGAAALPGAPPRPVPSVTTRSPGLPSALDAVLARCLASEPAQRYASCREVYEDLAALRPVGAAAHEGGRQVLGLARLLERLHQERLHALKNLVGMVKRFQTQPEKLAGHFFAPGTLARLAELAGPGLTEDVEALLREAGPRPGGALAPAVSALAARRAELAAMAEDLARLATASPEGQRTGLAGWHERLTNLGKVVVEALRALDVDLGEVVGRAGRDVASVLHLRVDLGEARTVRSADAATTARELTTVFEDLFQNAAQAGARRVTVKGALTPNETHVALEVANDGAPIPAAVADALFHGRSLTTKPEGTGTGLATCRDLLARHGGTILLASTSPVRFVVTLDRGRMGTAAPANEEVEPC